MGEIGSLDECLLLLERYPAKVGQAVAEAMKTTCPVGRTGQLRDSISWRANGDEIEVTANTPYASYARYGRGPVRPHHVGRSKKTGRFTKGYLKWEEYNGSQGSIHHGGSGTVFSRYAKDAPANDFVTPAYEKARPEILTLT